MSADVSSATLAELIWEVAQRLDQLGPPVIYLFERTDPELEELTVYNGNGPLRGYRGFHSPVGTPDVVIMPAGEAHEMISQKDGT